MHVQGYCSTHQTFCLVTFSPIVYVVHYSANGIIVSLTQGRNSYSGNIFQNIFLFQNRVNRTHPKFSRKEKTGSIFNSVSATHYNNFNNLFSDCLHGASAKRFHSSRDKNTRATGFKTQTVFFFFQA